MKKFKKIYVEITNICNKDCSFCSKDKRSKRKMSIQEFETVLNKIKNHTNYIYLHIKGEPLIHNQLEEILFLCKKYNINVNITTNGTLLKEKLDIIIRSNIVRQINISLHSFEDGNFKDYIEKIFDSSKEILNKTSIILVYRFWALKENKLSSENKEIIKEIIEYFKIENDLLVEINKNKNIKLQSNLYLNKELIFKWPSLENEYISDKGYCYGMKTHIGILSDGTVVPCCLDSEGIITLGNIYKESLYDIFEKERSKEIINNFKNGKVCEELCKRCSYKQKLVKNKSLEV